MERKEVIVIAIVFVVFAGVALWLLAGGWDEIADRLFVETVYVDAAYEEIFIDRPSSTIHLTINGNGNDVTVTKNTGLRELKINGNENSIALCEGIHDPEIENLGIENEVIFAFC